jgi:hypothetical protein
MVRRKPKRALIEAQTLEWLTALHRLLGFAND